MPPLLSADPGNKPTDLWVCAELLDSVELSAELLFGGEPVDRAVAVRAEHGALAHLLTRKPLLKPSIGVNCNRDEVMERQPSLSSTELAVALSGSAHVFHQCPLMRAPLPCQGS